MKMTFSFIIIVLTAFTLNMGCSGSRVVAGSNEENRETMSSGSTIQNPDRTMSFIDHLRKIPGVKVSGNGINATVLIRGAGSVTQSSEPLVVLNGVVLNGGVQAANSSIQVDQIKQIRVLKSGADTAMYGVRGTNGVIEVILKK